MGLISLRKIINDATTSTPYIILNYNTLGILVTEKTHFFDAVEEICMPLQDSESSLTPEQLSGKILRCRHWFCLNSLTLIFYAVYLTM